MEATLTLEVTLGTLAILKSINCDALWIRVVFTPPSVILITLPSVSQSLSSSGKFRLFFYTLFSDTIMDKTLCYFLSSWHKLGSNRRGTLKWRVASAMLGCRYFCGSFLNCQFRGKVQPSVGGAIPRHVDLDYISKVNWAKKNNPVSSFPT